MSEVWLFLLICLAMHEKGLNTGSDLRPSLPIQCPCQMSSHPGLIPYQHPQGPLIGTNWGEQKETILIISMSIIRSLFMHTAPIWFPITSPKTDTKRRNTRCLVHKTEENPLLSTQNGGIPVI